MTAALVTQDEMCMRHIILSSVACLGLPYFFTLSQKRNDFRGKNVTDRKMRVVISSITFEKFLFLRKIKRDIFINVHRSYVKYQLLDFCLTVHHQLGKVIQMNQLDATMIY